MWNQLLPYATSYDDFVSPDEDARLEAFISDPEAAYRQERDIQREEVDGIIKGAMTHLPARERYILERRFGMRDGTELTPVIASTKYRRSTARSFLTAKPIFKPKSSGSLATSPNASPKSWRLLIDALNCFKC